MAEAHARLAAARAALVGEFLSAAVSSAYYAMLYAARAALSEENRNAKTHRGTWHLFDETFVANGRFDAELFRQARGSEPLRLGADYDAEPVAEADANAIVGTADRFVAAVVAMFS
jgi:uncharacterized protein (UPF0332 family)